MSDEQNRERIYFSVPDKAQKLASCVVKKPKTKQEFDKRSSPADLVKQFRQWRLSTNWVKFCHILHVSAAFWLCLSLSFSSSLSISLVRPSVQWHPPFDSVKLVVMCTHNVVEMIDLLTLDPWNGINNVNLVGKLIKPLINVAWKPKIEQYLFNKISGRHISSNIQHC